MQRISECHRLLSVFLFEIWFFLFLHQKKTVLITGPELKGRKVSSFPLLFFIAALFTEQLNYRSKHRNTVCIIDHRIERDVLRRVLGMSPKDSGQVTDSHSTDLQMLCNVVERDSRSRQFKVGAHNPS